MEESIKLSGQFEVPETMSDVSLTIRIHGCMPTVVKFTNVPISIVHEAVAHINDNSEPGN